MYYFLRLKPLLWVYNHYISPYNNIYKGIFLMFSVMKYLHKQMMRLRAEPSRIPDECWLQATGVDDPDYRLEPQDTFGAELVHAQVQLASLIAQESYHRAEHRENLRMARTDDVVSLR
jgi:hypothetical protein